MRVTYLLDGEAIVMLAIFKLLALTKNRRPEPGTRRKKLAATYLTMFAVLVLFFFYENSVVGSCRIPRFERADSMYRARVELMSLAMQSTRVRQTGS